MNIGEWFDDKFKQLDQWRIGQNEKMFGTSDFVTVWQQAGQTVSTWDVAKTDWNPAHSTFFSENIYAAGFGSQVLLNPINWEVTGMMRNKDIDEWFRNQTGMRKTSQFDFDPSNSETFREVVYPTHQVVSSFAAVWGLSAIPVAGPYLAAGGAGGIPYLNEYLDKWLVENKGLKKGDAWYAKNASRIGSILGLAYSSYDQFHKDKDDPAKINAGTTPTTDTSVADALKSLTALLSPGSASPRLASPRAGTTPLSPGVDSLDKGEVIKLAGLGLFGVAAFLALRKL